MHSVQIHSDETQATRVGRLRRLLIALGVVLTSLCARADGSDPPAGVRAGHALAATSALGRARFHSVYYHMSDATFWANLASTAAIALPNGTKSTLRDVAIASINQNFQQIKNLGFDTVGLVLPDEDDWSSQFGGGFSYDPTIRGRGKPGFAVAEEIIVRIAASWGLKVIFDIAPSIYRMSQDGAAADKGLADEFLYAGGPADDMTKFIESVMNSPKYYGVQNTTGLSTIGLKDGPTRSFIGDSRIIGWQFSAEWNPYISDGHRVATNKYVFQKYWNYFYGLVHQGGANNAFAGAYLGGGPAQGKDAKGNLIVVDAIRAFKKFFAPGSGIIEPDLVGMEFYAAAPTPQAAAQARCAYDLRKFYSDAQKMIDAMENNPNDRGVYDSHDFAIPSYKIYFGEGSANRNDSTDSYATMGGLNQYFEDALQVLDDNRLAGLQFFASDTLTISGGLKQGYVLHPGITDTNGHPVFDIFQSTYGYVGSTALTPFSGVAPDPLVPGSYFCDWHSNPRAGSRHGFGTPSDFVDHTLSVSSNCSLRLPIGYWKYTGTTNIGRWIGEALSNHTNGNNFKLYAYPNPVDENQYANSTLYWDISHMPRVKSFEIRIGSGDGAILKTDSARTGQQTIALQRQAGSMRYLLYDTTNGGRTLLGTATVEVRAANN